MPSNIKLDSDLYRQLLEAERNMHDLLVEYDYKDQLGEDSSEDRRLHAEIMQRIQALKANHAPN